ncbi:MAG: radical SAM/SPASM domain-containing protein [Nanoarchaeota archaeon]|nr:radical SAM/SPASM domain-containing protein [Nanoarchaeota archaeon]
MLKEDIFTSLITKAVTSKLLRKPILKQLEKRMRNTIVEKKSDVNLRSVQEKKFMFFNSMVQCAVKNLEKGYITPDVVKKMTRVLVRNQLVRDDASKETIKLFEEKHGQKPPSFLVFSPTQKCNLKCIGCYADSEACSNTSLPFETVDKIVGETFNVFGNRFMTISGGEPFMYNENGKTLFDIWEKYSDMFFLVYTNGTLITPEAAKRLAELGNVTLAISVEGTEKETDERRGAGVYKRILEAFKNLREAGVPFGVSVTPTKKNYDTLMGEEFYDNLFEKEGVTYMWQFQLMPVGRGKEAFDLVVSPTQRVELYKKWKQLIEEKQYCVADFWNSGVLSDGCVAYGRHGGFLYVDWDGKIMPCVFVPYYEDNIKDLYAEGKGLADAVFSNLMTRGRNWQKEYGLDNKKNPHNWLMPCSIRDHYENFRKNILTPEAKPENKEAKEALESEEYKEIMIEFDKETEKLTEPIWKEEYMKN